MNFNLLKLAELYFVYASRTIDAIFKKVKFPIIRYSQGDFTTYIAMKETDDMYIPAGSISTDEINVKLNDGYNSNEYKRIAAIWSDDPITGIYLFGAALYFDKKIIADNSVTFAAQEIIKRYYNQNKNNASLVQPEVVETNPQNANFPELRAAYLGKQSSEAESALLAGEELKKFVKESDLIDIVSYKWEKSYQDDVKTKRNKGMTIKQPSTAPAKGKQEEISRAPLKKE